MVGNGLLYSFRKIAGLNPIACSHAERPFDGVSELAHVSRPIVAANAVETFRGKTDHFGKSFIPLGGKIGKLF